MFSLVCQGGQEFLANLYNKNGNAISRLEVYVSKDYVRFKGHLCIGLKLKRMAFQYFKA